MKKIIHSEFGIDTNPAVLKTIGSSIKEFETKGKEITKQDLQNIIEEQLDEYNSKDKYLEIIDFEAKTSKYKQASASIKVRYGDKVLLGQANGVGAVDAIITALKSSIKDHDKLYISITVYNV